MDEPIDTLKATFKLKNLEAKRRNVLSITLLCFTRQPNLHTATSRITLLL